MIDCERWIQEGWNYGCYVALFMRPTTPLLLIILYAGSWHSPNHSMVAFRKRNMFSEIFYYMVHKEYLSYFLNTDICSLDKSSLAKLDCKISTYLCFNILGFNFIYIYIWKLFLLFEFNCVLIKSRLLKFQKDVQYKKMIGLMKRKYTNSWEHVFVLLMLFRQLMFLKLFEEYVAVAEILEG